MSTPKTVAFHTLGCKLNFSETSSIRRSFESQGFNALAFTDPADIYVINTCSVTDFADRKCRYAVRKALRKNPQAKVVVIGCYAQLKPKEIAEIPGVDLVLGAAEKFNAVNYIDQLGFSTDKGMIKSTDISAVNQFQASFSMGDRTRSFLKVQDGCNYKCTFCTIPQARGASRSSTIEESVKNAEAIAASGVKEIVLTGVNLGDFGNGTEVIEGVKPKKEALFIDLIKALDNVQGIERFRISSIEPNLLTKEIIDFVAQSNKFVPHFHVPLQSGSNTILKKMSRRYLSNLYQDRVNWIKSAMPHACIGVDVIVGFPGETEELFQESYDFIKNLDVSYLHVFTYSERANTPANEMDNVVPVHIRRERNEKLRLLSNLKKEAFYNAHLNKTKSVLVEAQTLEGKVFGFTDNYIKVSLPYDESTVNTIQNVQLNAYNQGVVEATVCS